MKDNKTETWKNAPPSTLYQLPHTCPKCGDDLVTVNMHLGTFPYQYADLEVICYGCHQKYNFCYPQHPIMGEGIHIYDEYYDTTEIEFHIKERPECPFHNLEMEIQRFYGNLTYNDGTKKVQLKCPKCNYYQRLTL